MRSRGRVNRLRLGPVVGHTDDASTRVWIQVVDDPARYALRVEGAGIFPFQSTEGGVLEFRTAIAVAAGPPPGVAVSLQRPPPRTPHARRQRLVPHDAAARLDGEHPLLPDLVQRDRQGSRFVAAVLRVRRPVAAELRPDDGRPALHGRGQARHVRRRARLVAGAAAQGDGREVPPQLVARPGQPGARECAHAT